MKRRPVLQSHVWQVAALDTTLAAFEACRSLGQGNRSLSLVKSVAGQGKTFAAETYISEHANTYHAFVPPRCLLTTHTLLERLYEAFGAVPDKARNYDLIQEFAGFLNDTEDAFLIIDEADRLRPMDLDLVRELAELSGAPICLLGCEGLETTIRRVPAVRHRVGFVFTVPAVTKAELAAHLGRRFSAAIIAEIHQQTHGNMRHILALLENLNEIRNADGETIIDKDTVLLASAECLLGAA